MENTHIHSDDQIVGTVDGITKYGRIRDCTTDIIVDRDIYFEHDPLGPFLNVFWHPDGNTQTVFRDDVKLSDRVFKLGSWVQYEDVIGRINGLRSAADLQIIGSSQIIPDISNEKLLPVECVTLDSTILYKGWIGKVTHVHRKVWLDLSDGSRCTVDCKFLEKILNPLEFKRDYLIYPGRKIHGQWNALVQADWEVLVKTSDTIHEEFSAEINDSKIISVDIEWIGQIPGNEDKRPHVIIPVNYLNAIVVLDPPDHFSLALGSIRSYIIENGDKFFFRSDWEKGIHQQMSSPSKRVNTGLSPGSRVLVECIKVETVAEVLWMDGSNTAIPAVLLQPMTSSELNFAPGDYLSRPTSVFGVVQLIKPMEALLNVNWIDGEETSESRESVFDVTRHLKFSFRPGSIVIKSRPGVYNFTAGWVVNCLTSGQVQVKSATSREVHLLSPADLISLDLPNWNEQPKSSNEIIPANMMQGFVSKTLARFTTSTSSSAPVSPNKDPPVRSCLDFSRFTMIETTPSSHTYLKANHTPNKPSAFANCVQKDIKLLKEGLPDGIWVKGFEDRMDLFSILIAGPENTPYEDSVFLFEAQLPQNYPTSPPLFKYITYTNQRINPNLYQEGKVCVSLLNTWSGNAQEKWSSKKSTFLQVLVSIQGLILVAEPYFNEPGFEKSRNSKDGNTQSRNYNEVVVINMIGAAQKLMENPPSPWEWEMANILMHRIPRLISRVKSWMEAAEKKKTPEVGFALFPLTTGFRQSMKAKVETLKSLHASFCGLK